MSRKATDKGKHWTDRDKLKAIAAFAATGSAVEVEKLTGVPAGTVNYWKTLPWWFEEMEKLRKAEDEELVSQHTKIIKTTLLKLEERIERGDIVIDKLGQERAIPIKARDLGSIVNSIGQRREKLREGQSEHTSKAVTVAERLKHLEDQFTKFVTSKVVDGEVIHKVIEINAPIIVEETQNEGKEGIEEARKEGIEVIREERNDEGNEGDAQEGQEVLNAFSFQKAG